MNLSSMVNSALHEQAQAPKSDVCAINLSSMSIPELACLAASRACPPLGMCHATVCDRTRTHALHIHCIAYTFYPRTWSLRAAGLALDQPFWLDVWLFSLSLFGMTCGSCMRNTTVLNYHVQCDLEDQSLQNISLYATKRATPEALN